MSVDLTAFPRLSAVIDLVAECLMNEHPLRPSEEVARVMAYPIGLDREVERDLLVADEWADRDALLVTWYVARIDYSYDWLEFSDEALGQIRAHGIRASRVNSENHKKRLAARDGE